MKFSSLVNITFIIALFKFGISQDIHFSQYNLSPLNLNPSLTGAFQGDLRFIGNHRNQWSSVSNPYATFGFSFEKEASYLNYQYLLISNQSRQSWRFKAQYISNQS